MSTTRILLPLETAVVPTSNPATKSTGTSAGTPPANAPAVTETIYAFDQTTDQTIMWTFRMPSDYVSGGSVFIKWTSVPTSGAVIWKGGISPRTDGVTLDGSATAFNAADLSATVTVPASSGLVTETSWALTVTGVAAGRLVTVFIGRRAGAAGDTAAGNANLLAAEFEYTS